MPRGGVNDFPPNFYINCIQDEIGSKPYFGICDVCEKDWLVSQYRCIDCDLDICKFCVHDHRLFSHMSGRQSNIIRIETGNIGTHQTSERFCNYHKDEHLQMFCLTCDLLVCVSCVCDLHKKHDTITLTKKLQLARKHLQSELDQSQDEIKKVKWSLTKLHEIEKQGDKTADDALNQIQDHLHDVITHLQRMAAEKSEQIQAVRGKYIKEIRDYETELAAYLDQLQRGSNFLSELQEEDMCLELLKCFQKYKEVLETTEKTVVNKSIHQNTFTYLPGGVVERFGMVGIGRGNLQATETLHVLMRKEAPPTIFMKCLGYVSKSVYVVLCLFVLVCLVSGFYQFGLLFTNQGFTVEYMLGALFYAYICVAGGFAYRKSRLLSLLRQDEVREG